MAIFNPVALGARVATRVPPGMTEVAAGAVLPWWNAGTAWAALLAERTPGVLQGGRDVAVGGLRIAYGTAALALDLSVEAAEKLAVCYDCQPEQHLADDSTSGVPRSAADVLAGPLAPRGNDIAQRSGRFQRPVGAELVTN